MLAPCLSPAVAQDRYSEVWKIYGTAEEDEQRFESTLYPMQNFERLLSDEMNRGDDWLSTLPSPVERAFPTARENESARRETSRDTIIAGDPPGFPEDAGTRADLISSDPVATAGFRRLQVAEDVFAHSTPPDHSYGWQLLPPGLLYPSYLAGPKESRMQFTPLHDFENDDQYWEAVLGGRVGIVRYGTRSAQHAEGIQLDVEGAVFARVLPNQPSAALAASDYRAGLLATWKTEGTAVKAGYYHISSHVGDEYWELFPGFVRINYVRDALVTGIRQQVTASTQMYGELAYAAGYQGGAEPLELQFGAEYAPMDAQRWTGVPFAGVNGHWREEFSGTTGMNVVAGWTWQSARSGHRLRLGFQYYDGPSLQYQFFDQRERLIGGGVWLDY